MKLGDLLFKYESNPNLKMLAANALKRPTLCATVKKNGDSYIIEPANLFVDIFHVSKIELEIREDGSVVRENCGCLQFFKTKECIHVGALCFAGLLQINKALCDKEYNEYLLLKSESTVFDTYNKLTNDIRSTNPFFNKIHLFPVIEEKGDNKYELSVKIGNEKDYIIKSLYEFIANTENHVFCSYGQKLEFVHSYECLDEQSKIFYILLSSIVKENDTKSIEVRKQTILRILEIFRDNIVYYRGFGEEKVTPRKVLESDEFKLNLDEISLKITTPHKVNCLICGVNNAYFIGEDVIYAYKYKNRIDRKLYEYLFKVSGELRIDFIASDFIANLYPIINGSITIDKKFYEKYPIPKIRINSYFKYENENVYLESKLQCGEADRDNPYLNQFKDGYKKVIEKYGFTGSKNHKVVLNGLDNIYKFLTSDISPLRNYGDVFYDKEMSKLKTKKSGKAHFKIGYNVGLLEFNLEGISQEELEAMIKAYEEEKKYVKLSDDTILEVDEENVKEARDFLEDFNLDVKNLGKPVKKNLNYVLKLISGVDTNISMDAEIVRIIKDIQNYKNSSFLVPEAYGGNLRPYQTDGFRWLKTLAKYDFGGILADDMGLGKSLEIISFLSSDDSNKPSIIICPMSLVYNWQMECYKWNLNRPVETIIGSSDDREKIISSINNTGNTLYVTSYDSLRRDIDLYKDKKFRFIIADEAQFIKNQFTQKSEAIKSLQSEINYALTGTPIENGLSDLWSIFDFLMPGYLSSYSHFKNRYESLIMHSDDEALKNLQHRVSPFILRRLKKDVLTELPEKIEDYYYYKMDNRQQEVYDSYVAKIKDDLNSGSKNVLAYLTRLRQICITPELILQEEFANTKIDLAIDLINSSVESGHRILLFSQFSQSFNMLSRELDKRDIKYFILDGQTKAKTRMEMVDDFNKNDDVKVFLISLKAGGTGLNLIGADMVIHLDPWWNSSAMNQATDRAYRLGQEKNVTVLKLICKNSIEEKVVKLQELKTDLASSIVLDENNTNYKLSKEDILSLLE